MFAAPLAQFSEQVVQYYLEKAASPAGVLGIVAFLLLAAVTVIAPRLKWVYLPLAIYCGSFGILRQSHQTPLSPPFSWFAPVSQAVTGAMLLLILLATIRPPPLRRRRLHIGLFVALLAFQIVLASRTVVAGFAARGGGILVIWLLMFVVFAIGLASWLYDRDQVSRLIRSVAWAAGAMVIASVAQFALSPSAVFLGDRMTGTTPNPQRLAIYLAATLPYCAYAALEPRGLWRAVYGSMAGLSMVMIVASGSRTGMLMAAMALLVFFRAQVGRAAVFGLAAVLAAGTGYLVIGEAVGLGAERFTDTTNTRAEVWATLLATFAANPLIGSDTELAGGESSYLSVAASAGLVGLVPALVFAGLLLWTAARLLRSRRAFGPDHARAADLVAAVFVPIVVVCFTFEAHLMGTLTELLLVLYATMALAGALLEQRAERPIAVEPGGDGAAAVEWAEWDGGVPAGR